MNDSDEKARRCRRFWGGEEGPRRSAGAGGAGRTKPSPPSWDDTAFCWERVLNVVRWGGWFFVVALAYNISIRANPLDDFLRAITSVGSQPSSLISVFRSGDSGFNVPHSPPVAKEAVCVANCSFDSQWIGLADRIIERLVNVLPTDRLNPYPLDDRREKVSGVHNVLFIWFAWFAAYVGSLCLLGNMATTPMRIAWICAHVAFASSVVWAFLFANVGQVHILASSSMFLAMFVLIVYTPRHIFYLVSRSQIDPNLADKGVTALPSQQLLLDVLESQIREGTNGYGGSLVTIRGRWGQGKTTTLLIVKKKAQESQVPVAVFNTWRHQTDSVLENAIYGECVKAVFGTLKKGWRQRPFYLPLFIKYIGNIRVSMGIGNGAADAQIQARPASVMLFSAMCRLVRVAKKMKRPLVVIVDETDRVEPAVAQTMLPLMQRFLMQSGIVVLMPYVEEQLRYKVFHPAVVQLPELRGAAETLMLRYKSDMGGGKARDEDDLIWSGLSHPTNGNGSAALERKSGESHPYHSGRLLAFFMSIVGNDPLNYDIYYGEMEERFLRASRHDMQSVGPDDLPHLLFAPAVRSELGQMMGEFGVKIENVVVHPSDEVTSAPIVSQEVLRYMWRRFQGYAPEEMACLDMRVFNAFLVEAMEEMGYQLGRDIRTLKDASTRTAAAAKALLFCVDNAVSRMVEARTFGANQGGGA